MGGDKHSKDTVRFDSRKLAELTKKDVPEKRNVPEETGSDGRLASALAALKKAAGTKKASDPPLAPRTKTLDDPLTTSVLAEVARRSQPIEASPEEADDAMTLEPTEDAAAVPPPPDRQTK
jgi:hypothetical protein